MTASTKRTVTVTKKNNNKIAKKSRKWQQTRKYINQNENCQVA